jgi:hypothetical protein
MLLTFTLSIVQMRLLTASAFICFATHLEAQIPGTRLSVDVTVNSVVMRSDTVVVAYSLYNHSTSQDSLFTFTVAAPTPVLHITSLAPDSIWKADTFFSGDQRFAQWVTLDLLPPGATSPLLSLEAVGLPGIVTHRAEGGWPLPACCDDDSSASGATYTLDARSVQGSTVGVDVLPGSQSVQSLLARLRELTQSACSPSLFWITSSTLCTDLLQELDVSESFRASGAVSQAQNSLTHYSNLLSGPSPGTLAPGVTSPAYWLLRTNAEIVRLSL